MNYSTYRFTLDIHKTRSQVSIPVMFQDTWVRFFINLTDGGKPYHIADGCKAVLFGKKADGTALVNDCEIVDNTRIVYTFNNQTASCLGAVECEIRLYNLLEEGLHLTTPSFVILVEDRVVDDDYIESNSDTSAIDHILESEIEREEAESERKESEEERREAEAYRQEEEAKRQEAERFRDELPSWFRNSIETLQERMDDCDAAYKAADTKLSERCDLASNRITRIDGTVTAQADSIALLITRHWEQDSRLNEYRNRITALENAKLAPKEYVDNRFDEILGDGATDALDGIAELARALGEDKNFATTMATAIGGIKTDIAILNAWYENSTYVPLKWTKNPTVTPSSMRARGESIASVTVSWAFSRTPETLTVAGVAQTNKAITSFTPTLAKPITWDNTSSNKWTISGSVTKPDGTMDTLTATTSPITFGNYSFSGYTTEKTFNASTHASESMQTTSNLKISAPTSFVGTGSGYIYFFFPKRYGTPTGYKYNGFVYDFEYIESKSFANKHGYSEDYYFCRTTQTLTSENRTLEILY